MSKQIHNRQKTPTKGRKAHQRCPHYIKHINVTQTPTGYLEFSN